MGSPAPVFSAEGSEDSLLSELLSCWDSELSCWEDWEEPDELLSPPQAARQLSSMAMASSKLMIRFIFLVLSLIKYIIKYMCFRSPG